MKTCSTCTTQKDLSAYQRRPESKDGLRDQCIDCRASQSAVYRVKNKAQLRTRKAHYREKNADLIKKRNRQFFQNHPTRRQEYSLRQLYKLTLQEYAMKLEQQGGVCANCKSLEIRVDKRTGSPRNLAVDHNHTTGQIRGLLCADCNTALGLLKESPEAISALLAYLKKWQVG